MQITDAPKFLLADRKLETFNLGAKATLFTVVDGDREADVQSPGKVARLSVARRLHGDWYAEAEGLGFRVSAVGEEPAAAINAAFAKVA